MHDNQPGNFMPQPQAGQPYQQYPLPPNTGMVPNTASQKPHTAWGLIISLVISVILLLASLGFGAWAFIEREDYKKNSDQKSADAAAVAVQQESSRKDKEFIEREKSPFKTYQGPDTYGSLHIQYPKTWSAYVVESTRSSILVDGYFHPGFVPAISGGTAFALRVQVTNQTYDQEMRLFEGNVKAGKVKVSPYIPKNVPGITGSRVTGEISTGQSGTMVLIPLRDRTIKISANAEQFINDFNNIILEKLKFSP